MMFRAEEWGFRERGTNPCLGIARNLEKKIARFLDAEELARLGRALDASEDRWPEAVAAIRLLALIGCRRGEVLNLRWRNIGAVALNLGDSKTGPRTVPLGEAARALIKALPGPRTPSCSRRTPDGRTRTKSSPAGAPSAKTRSSAGCACTTSATRRPATPSWRAKTCPWSANCLATGVIARRQAMPTSPIPISSRRPKRSGAPLRRLCGRRNGTAASPSPPVSQA